MKKISIINENMFAGIGKRSKGGIVRKENEIKKVDLGLPSGTIWAECNLGASSPEEYGDYYAWGETELKNKYSWNTYKFGTKDNLTKYNEEDGKTILDPEDDAAHVVLGGEWHMPTKEQIQELFDNTTIEDSELNGVKGTLFTSKTNGNTLFFPFSGLKNDFSVNSSGFSSFNLSSSRNKRLPNYAMRIYSYFNSPMYGLIDDKFDDSILNCGYRCCGYSVRGVLDKK